MDRDRELDMNVNLKIKLPLVNINNPLDKKIYTIDSYLLLNPFYALEEDVLNPFTQVQQEDMHWVRKVLFNSSIKVYRLTKVLEELNYLNPEELALLRRDFTICLSVNEVGKQLYKDISAQISRSKTLGDFSVSTTKRNDLGLINKTLSDSNNCIEEMKKLIEDIKESNITPSSFVKGKTNERTLGSDRLWWLSDLDDKVSDGFASKKYLYKGRKYKAGFLNFKSGSV